MDSLVCYKTMPRWSAASIPQGLRQRHNTQVGTWAKMRILKGTLDMLFFNDGEADHTQVFSVANQPGFIAPQKWHRIAATSDDVECQLAFWCKPEDASVKRFKCAPPHSEVLNLWNLMNKRAPAAVGSTSTPSASAPRMLDIGCGGGRNLLFFHALGYECEGLDRNAATFDTIQQAVADAKAKDVEAGKPNGPSVTLKEIDLNSLTLTDAEAQYDVVVCTVVLQFLQPHAAQAVLDYIKSTTKPGGHVVIVSVADEAGKPVTVLAHDEMGTPLREITLPFALKPDQLKTHFDGWSMLKYAEELGQLHQYDANGQYHRLKFASMIARKP